MLRLSGIVVLLASTTLIAQTPSHVRPLDQVSANFTPVSAPAYWYAWGVVAPKGQALPADAAQGFVATNQLAYVFYQDKDGSGFVPTMAVRRSVTGGFSWEAPTELLKLSGNQQWRTEESGGSAEGRSAFLFTTTYDGSTGRSEIQVWATEDQGKTWMGPINASTGMAAGSLFYVNGQRRDQFRHNVSGALGDGVFHLCYEAATTWQGSSSTRKGDLYYTAVKIQNGQIVTAVTETRVNRMSTAGQVDVDYPSIAVDRTTVAICWLDDRASPGSNKWNNCYSVVDLAGGATMGAVAPETNHTNLTTALVVDPAPPNVAVAAPNIYVTIEDARNASANGLTLDYSNALGTSYTSVTLATATSTRGKHALAAEGNTVAVSWLDASSFAAAIVDPTSGLGITGATVAAKQVSSVSANALFNMDLRGNTVALFYEDAGTGGEDAVVGYSPDLGANWKEARVDPRSGDVDENYGAITGNGDILNVHIWSDVGNSNNHTYVTGLKLPGLENLYKSNGTGFELTDADPTSQGKVAALLYSGSTNGSLSFGSMGFSPNIANDPIYQAYLSVLASSPAQFLATVDSSGEATWTTPDYAGILNLNLEVVAVILDPAVAPTNAGFFLQFTDPAR